MEQKEIPHMPVDSIQPDAQQKQEYQQYVKSVTPTHNLWTQMGKAFLTGGIICCIGQGILNYTGNVLGMDPQTSGSWCSLLLVFLSVVLTAFHIYHCGAGDIVWDFFQLGVGVDPLGVTDVWNPCGVV